MTTEIRQRKQPAAVEKQPVAYEQIEKTEEIKEIKPKKSRLALILLVLIVLAILTRFWSLNYPDQVVFDEVHFGKFGSYYILKQYYFDVHPPLGKLIVGFSAWLRGYRGAYLFDKIGDVYSEHDVPYVFMRSLHALFGAALVPLVFRILTETNHSLQASLLGASMVLFDTALTTQCRFILLDASLIFFDVLSVLAWIKLYKLRREAFSWRWWLWLVLTGTCIALTSSVKMVGLFVVALIGVCTLIDLWRLIDVKRGLTHAQCVKEFFARVLGLIVVPICAYLFWYGVHFAVLSKSGPGDAFMSPPFQSSLEGNRFNQESRGIFYNATVTILHYNTNAYLHSHAHNYPLRYVDDRVSSQGQQVTGYPHVDDNNKWRIIAPDDVYFTQGSSSKKKAVRMLHNKDIIQLQHIATGKFLLTHDVASPLTPTNQEVTAIDLKHQDFLHRKNETLFRLEFVDDPASEAYLQTIDVKFRLVHIPTGVGVSCHAGKYPQDWGFGQQEVNGVKNPKDSKANWIMDYVSQEYNTTVRTSLQNGNKPGFIKKYLELQAIQFKENANLVAPHPFQSTPITWPLLLRGISFWIKEPNQQVYLIGNPLVWALGFFCLCLHISVALVDAIIQRRGIADLGFYERRHLIFTGGFFVLGWCLHYLPFFIMGRALFLHHYLPALCFTFMITANMFDFVFRGSRVWVKNLIAAVLIALFAWVFVYFSPFTYGWPLTADQIEARRWLPSWDYSYGLKP